METRRRAGRPSTSCTSSSLHIYPSEMSGINSASCGAANNTEPRVVVQTLPAVEPSEERLTPAPSASVPQHLPNPIQADKKKTKQAVTQVQTRLRPHRSSWRDRYSPTEKKEPSKISAGSRRSSASKSNQESPFVKSSSLSPTSDLKFLTALSEPKHNDRWSYATEDVASIERNKQLGLKRDRTPSTDSAPESPRLEALKRKNKTAAQLSAKRKTPQVIREEKTDKQSKICKDVNFPGDSTQQNGKHAQLNSKQPNQTLKKVELAKIETQFKKSKSKTSKQILAEADGPGFCEHCKEEFTYLKLHLQTKHKGNECEPLEIVLTNKEVILPEPKIVSKQPETQTDEVTAELLAKMKKEEPFQIAKTVKEDSLIQKFGVRLLGMSLYPDQKVLAVSQRMIELVRLLRAAQGMDPEIQNLAQLLNCDCWPLITESIMYVAGYQEDGTFRNTLFVFDVGQAMKFCAYILKTEAIASSDFELEQQLRDFMNSIDDKIDEILPGASALKQVQYLDPGTVEVVSKIDDDRTGEMLEQNQVDELLKNIHVGETQQCPDDFILSDVLEVVASSSSSVETNLAGTSDFTAVNQSSNVELGEGELLLELSKAQTVNYQASNTAQVQIISQLPSAPVAVPVAMSASVKPPVVKKVSPVSVRTGTSLSPMTNVSQLSQVANAIKNSSAPSGNNAVRYVKIISSKSSGGLGNAQRKFCLLIPSQAVQKNIAVKNVGPSGVKVTTPSSPQIVMASEVVPTLTLSSDVSNNVQSATNPSLATLCGLNLDSEDS